MIFGISKVIPASGSVPREIASIDGRIDVESPFTTSAIWRVGTRPALSVVLSAART